MTSSRPVSTSWPASMTCWPPATPPRWPPPRPISTCSVTATWSCWRARTIRCTKKRSSRSASAPNRAWAAAWTWNRPAAAWLAQTNLMTETANLLDVQQRFQRVTGALPRNAAAGARRRRQAARQAGDFNDSLRRNPSFLSKQAGLQAAEAGIASAKGAFSPKFEFVASTGRNQNDPTPENRRINSTSVQLMMSYNLYRGGATRPACARRPRSLCRPRHPRLHMPQRAAGPGRGLEQHHQPEPAHAVPA